MTQQDRNNYWKSLAISHVFVAHEADIVEGETVVGQRNSFCLDIADEIEASEFVRLHFPAVAVGLVAGRVTNNEGQPRMRYTNRLYFLSHFSVDSNEDPAIPKSKEAAFELTYEVMMDFLNKLQSDYEESGGCDFEFRYIDENSYRWESVELMGANMCGWNFYFNDEEPYHFVIDENKWS